ncbi:hypothetical protein [Blastococcus sp. CT_GayMR16]|uniref:hypothetical protein n=1 Tax=Blastococcus sp. CT_GayMR16 TaxID=2559607 RepID=UPI00107381EF|nr:hypothetical protein [Blastococcus sp. CT_GayMR16]TFV91135.1 hypothetical protein E4P38_00540 [Blastococcus sp. CT_GayMR16]
MAVISALVLATVLALILWPNPPSPQGKIAPAVLQSSPPAPTYTDVPENEVIQAHAALHGLGEACGVETSSRSLETVERQLAVLLAFARSHPDGAFEIDDEDGAALSLLLVLKEELRSCDPSQLPRVEALLPPRFRGSESPDS